ELRQEFYKIGISHDFKTSPYQVTITLAGLEENMSKGLDLLHYWLTHAIPDQQVYSEYVQTILESREAAKKDKNKIMHALQQYAKFGKDLRSRDVVSKERLEEGQCSAMTDKMKALF